MDFEKNDVVVGAFVLGSILAFALALVAINWGRVSSETYHLGMRLPEISGIDKGVEVIYKGYKAGSVDRVNVVYEPELGFDIRLAIKKEIRLHQGAVAVARARGFAGGKYVEITEPQNASGPLLQDGTVIQSVREADIMAQANEVMDQAHDALLRFHKEKITEGLADTVKNAKASLAELNRVLINTNALIQENRASIKGSLDQTNGITTKTNAILEHQSAAVERILKNLDQATGHLPAIAGNVEELTADLKKHPWRLIRKGEP